VRTGEQPRRYTGKIATDDPFGTPLHFVRLEDRPEKTHETRKGEEGRDDTEDHWCTGPDAQGAWRNSGLNRSVGRRRPERPLNHIREPRHVIPREPLGDPDERNTKARHPEEHRQRSPPSPTVPIAHCGHGPKH
jgi:hypothetical protein